MNWFRNLGKKAAQGELAPQVTSWERRSLQQTGPSAGSLPYTAYALMERDSMVQTSLTLKRLGVIAAPWKVKPASDSASAARKAAFVEEAFARMEGSPMAILESAMDAFGKGWSVQESVYQAEGDRLWLKAVRPKDPAFFGFEADEFGTVKGLILEVPGERARELPVEKFVLYVNRAGYGRYKGRSDLDAAYPHYQAKSALLAAWRLHLERFASPTMLGRFEPGVSSSDQEAVLRALNSLDSTAAIVHTNQIEISSVPGQPEASAGFMEAIDFHNREIARSILGQTLTTDEGRRVGSLALGKVHLQVLAIQLEAVRRDLADRVMTEQVIRPLVELNFGSGEIPVFEFEAADLSAFRTGQL